MQRNTSSANTKLVDIYWWRRERGESARMVHISGCCSASWQKWEISNYTRRRWKPENPDAWRIGNGACFISLPHPIHLPSLLSTLLLVSVYTGSWRSRPCSSTAMFSFPRISCGSETWPPSSHSLQQRPPPPKWYDRLVALTQSIDRMTWKLWLSFLRDKQGDVVIDSSICCRRR